MPNIDNPDHLDFDQIERDATSKLDLLKLRGQLQSLVDVAYPGYLVTLSKNGEIPVVCRSRTRPTLDFDNLTQTQQIEMVLNDGVMKLHPLFRTLQTRGSKMSFQSLMSLLSAGKKSGRFRSFGRGIWGLPKHILTAGEVFEEEK